MMTTMAALMGTLPIALGCGAGARGAPAARPGGGRRPARLADADALPHAGVLHLHGELQEWLAKRKVASAEPTPQRVDSVHGELGAGSSLAPQRRH